MIKKRDGNMSNTDIIERRHLIIQILITAIVVAMGVNLLSNLISGASLYQMLSIKAKIGLSVLLIGTPVIYLARYYLGKVIQENFPIVLLINKESGSVRPHGYYPAFVTTMIGSLFVEKLKTENLKLTLTQPLLGDLAEWILINYLKEISAIKINPGDFRVISYPIPAPNRLHFIDNVCGIFGDNVFVNALRKHHSDCNTFFGIFLPRCLKIERKLQKNKSTIQRAIKLKGTTAIPLEFLSFQATIVEIGPGALLLLQLEGYTPLEVTLGDKEWYGKIICKERIIEGKEVKELNNWIRIEIELTISYKLKWWMFWRRNFVDWYIWAKNTASRTKAYLDFNGYLERNIYSSVPLGIEEHQ